MNDRSSLARIDDMLAAIAIIEEIAGTKGTGYAIQSTVTTLALERAIEIVSEASRHIPDALKVREPDALWRQIAGIGNVLRHDYQSVRADIIWNAVETDVPTLKVALLRIRATIDRP